jgi:hypothetical protein
MFSPFKKKKKKKNFFLLKLKFYICFIFFRENLLKINYLPASGEYKTSGNKSNLDSFAKKLKNVELQFSLFKIEDFISIIFEGKAVGEVTNFIKILLDSNLHYGLEPNKDIV